MRYIILFLLIVLANNSQAQSDCISDFKLPKDSIDSIYEFNLGMSILELLNITPTRTQDTLQYCHDIGYFPIRVSSFGLALYIRYGFSMAASKLYHDRDGYSYYIDKDNVIKGHKFYPTKNGYGCFNITPYLDSLLQKTARFTDFEGPRYFALYDVLFSFLNYANKLKSYPKVEALFDTIGYVDNPEFWERELCQLNSIYKEYYLYNAYLSVHLKSARLNYNDHYLKYIKPDTNLKQAYIKLNKICLDYFKYATTYLIPHLESKINNKTHEHYKFHFSNECLGLKKIFEKPEVQNEINSFLE